MLNIILVIVQILNIFCNGNVNEHHENYSWENSYADIELISNKEAKMEFYLNNDKIPNTLITRATGVRSCEIECDNAETFDMFCHIANNYAQGSESACELTIYYMEGGAITEKKIIVERLIICPCEIRMK